LRSLILGIFLASLFSLSYATSAEVADGFEVPAVTSVDASKFIVQRIDLLKNRLDLAKSQLKSLQVQQEGSSHSIKSHSTKHLLERANLDIAVQKSNLESVSLELSESEQAEEQIEKDIQEIQNQLNVLSIFGSKVGTNSHRELDKLNNELAYQNKLLGLNKERSGYLLELKEIGETTLKLFKKRQLEISTALKSEDIFRLKEKEASSELGFQQQQSIWLQHLNALNHELGILQKQPNYDLNQYSKLQNEIFYVNENVSFTYLSMLISRYDEQLQQLQIVLSRSNSISLLNNLTDQVQVLSKQLVRINNLLLNRMEILAKRENLFLKSENKEVFNKNDFKGLKSDYEKSLVKVENSTQKLSEFKRNLDHVLQHELSARQNLPGFGAKGWVELGGELLQIPTLTFHIFKNLSVLVVKALSEISVLGWCLIGVFQFLWLSLFGSMNYFLKRIVTGIPDHEFGHINLKWLFIKVLDKNLIDLAIIGNAIWLFNFADLNSKNFVFLINLGFVWIFFKSIIMIARLCLVETMHDRAGHDVRLYYRLKWVFVLGGIVTALAVFIKQLPVMFEVKDLFDRVFLLFLFIASLFILRQWEVVPALFLSHIDESKTYLKRIIRLLGLLIPVVLLVNSIVGLFGYVNLIFTISWYESIFICVLVGYLITKGLLHDGMEKVSNILIRHVTNGWLWTEAFLKPFDRLLNITLFISSWALLFLLYGWDQQSTVVGRLNTLLNYPLLTIFNASITPLSIIELSVVISLLYWASRWTREFVYRLLLSRTKDLGLRNSLAIFSQYTMIVIGIFICLRVLGIDFKALTVVAGAFAFGVGLGLRDLANNFASGFLLLIERPLRVGDIVSVNQFEGEVTNIGGRAVTIRTWDHLEVLVPNSEIFSKSFTNWTAKDNIVRTVIDLKIDRHEHPQEVQSVIYELLEKNKDILKEPTAEVFLKEVTDELMEFDVHYYVNLRQIKSRISLRSEILIQIWEALKAKGIKPPDHHHKQLFKRHFPLLGIEVQP